MVDGRYFTDRDGTESLRIETETSGGFEGLNREICLPNEQFTCPRRSRQRLGGHVLHRRGDDEFYLALMGYESRTGVLRRMLRFPNALQLPRFNFVHSCLSVCGIARMKQGNDETLAIGSLNHSIGNRWVIGQVDDDFGIAKGSPFDIQRIPHDRPSGESISNR